MTFARALQATLILIIISLAPLLFVPLFPNIYQSPKTILVVVAASLLLLTHILSSVVSRRITLRTGSLTTPLILVTITLLTNTLVNQEARSESFYGKGLLLLTLTATSWLITQLGNKSWFVKLTTTATSHATAALSLLSIIQITYLYSQSFVPFYMQTRTFTPTGSLLHTTLILTLGLCITTVKAFTSPAKRIYNTLLSGIILVGIVANLSLILPSGEFAVNLLPYSASWSLLLDNAKSLLPLLFGTGLSNFAALFTMSKPLFLNQTFFWNTTPEVGSSELFTLVITGGMLLALALGAYALTALITSPKDSTHLPLRAGLGLTILFFLLFPGHLLIYLYIFLFAALLTPTSSSHELALNSLQLRFSLAALAITVIATTFYFVGRSSLAEHNLYLAQLAATNNQTKDVYDNTLRAVSLMPETTSYRLTYSQLNLALASSLSQSKSELTEQDRSEITQLVSIAIREAQAATTLRPSLAATWQNLGSIYRNLIGVAQGSEDFAAQYYGTAVAKDPGNPSLRVEYGGLFYQLADSEIATDAAVKSALLTRAIEQFQIAANLKPDYANAYYNLSKAQEKVGNKDAAIELLNKTLTLLDPLSQDYTTASQELQTLKSTSPQELITNPDPTPALP